MIIFCIQAYKIKKRKYVWAWGKYLRSLAYVDLGGFHLQLFQFPFICQIYSRMTTLAESTCQNSTKLEGLGDTISQLERPVSGAHRSLGKEKAEGSQSDFEYNKSSLLLFRKTVQYLITACNAWARNVLIRGPNMRTVEY